MNKLEIDLNKINNNIYLIIIFTILFKTISFIFVTIPFTIKHVYDNHLESNQKLLDVIGPTLVDSFSAYLIGLVIGIIFAKLSLMFVCKYGPIMILKITSTIGKAVLRMTNGK